LINVQNKSRWVPYLSKNSKERLKLSSDLKNVGIGRFLAGGGLVALIEDDEHDVPQPEEAATEVVKEVLQQTYI
jgi:hypothetical protein